MDFDKSKYRVWTWKSPLMLHWIINPGLAINELILGQRIPKVTLIERNSKKSLAEKGFVPCPHCNTIHSSLKWSIQNKTAFRNWFGLYCDHCAKIIPCLRNLTSLILLVLTFPIWIWFVKKWKEQWLFIQKEKFSKPLSLATPEFNWIAEGLGWGFFMFIIMNIFFPLIVGEKYKLMTLLLGLIIWTLGGLSFGYVVKKFIFKPLPNQSQDKTQEVT